MADVSTTLRDWSKSAASNSPSGSTNVGTNLDDNLREIQAVVRKYLASKGSDKASAATVDLSTADGFFIDITGTATITSFGTESEGISYLLQFDAAATLTHDAASLILPGGANITTAANDMCLVTSLGGGNWRVPWYQKAAGTVFQNDSDLTGYGFFLDEDDMASDDDTKVPSQQSVKAFVEARGKVKQVVNTTNTVVGTGVTQIPLDDTIPQNTEGDEFMTLAVTPSNALSTLKVEVLCNLSHSGTSAVLIAALFKDADANALAANWAAKDTVANGPGQVALTYYGVAGGTAAITFKVRAGSQTAGTTTFNGQSGGRLFGGVAASSITITEYLP